MRGKIYAGYAPSPPENGIRSKELLEKLEYADTMRKINNQYFHSE